MGLVGGLGAGQGAWLAAGSPGSVFIVVVLGSLTVPLYWGTDRMTGLGVGLAAGRAATLRSSGAGAGQGAAVSGPPDTT